MKFLGIQSKYTSFWQKSSIFTDFEHFLAFYNIEIRKKKFSLFTINFLLREDDQKKSSVNSSTLLQSSDPSLQMSHRKLSDESSSSKFEDSNISSDECDQIDVESASSGSNRSSATSGVCSVNSHQNNDVINNDSFRSSPPTIQSPKNEKDNSKKGNFQPDSRPDFSTRFFDWIFQPVFIPILSSNFSTRFSTRFFDPIFLPVFSTRFFYLIFQPDFSTRFST